ncbi:hypothetical protein JAAARDRAFT_28441 [Jaapia argillacea MUCL 33604]|uniref:Uncharacterized protein n=1 Tax=Jaapia argillacea MUCL 33604 TaxID=933084 RepID=A0A067QQ79_9AGAM|nr:hypothetical protein JAAARDRAFT_28441 [Jaapia argillacea MUCL 33604]
MSSSPWFHPSSPARQISNTLNTSAFTPSSSPSTNPGSKQGLYAGADGERDNYQDEVVPSIALYCLV